MATINGIASASAPPLPSPQSQPPDSNHDSLTPASKRKRANSTEIPDLQTNGTSEAVQTTAASTTASNERNPAHSDIRDLIDILKGLDTVPSILERPLNDRPSLTEPQAKRQKAQDGSEVKNTILTRAAAHAYESLDAVLEDLNAAVLDMEEKMQLPNSAARNHYMPVGSAHSELGLKVSAFQKKAHELVRRHKMSTEQAQKKDGDLNGINGRQTNTRPQITTASGDNKKVLTLYGSAPQPKQLFSSFQLPTNLEGEVKQILPPIREGGLPNGITTTQIIPMASSNLVEVKKATLGDVFPSPANIIPLQPPKPSSSSTTKEKIVGWYQPSSFEPRYKSASYSNANVSCGQWLDYSNATSPKSSKKRHRDRTLSLSGSKSLVPEADSAEVEAAKRDALFRSAYCSFAPTKDNTAAVMPTGMLERIWWQQSGERAYNRAVENVAELTGPNKAGSDATNISSEDDIKKFEEAVEGWEKDVVDPSLVELAPADEKSIQEKDVEEVLEGISELLETLNSYQRIRHMSLNPTIRAAGGLLSAPDTSITGTPSKPGDAEQATYEMLKAQLSLMIATLPPYAVAKLDADRLSELRVSTKIEIQVDNFRGVMEEDESAAKARALATASAANVARAQQQQTPIHRTPSASQVYGNQFSAPRPTPTPSHQYYGGAPTPSRAPQSSMQRHTSAAAPIPYSVQRPAAAAPFRPPQQGYNTPNYGQAAPRPAQQYAPSSQPQQYMQQAAAAQSFLRAPVHNYQGVPQTAPQNAMNGRYPSSGYPHQAQPTQNGPDYRYNAASAMANRQNSPQVTMYSQASPAQARPAYSSPTPPLPQDSRRYLSNPMMTGGSPQVTQPPQSQPSQSTGYHTYLTQQEQATMMEQQRAKLAAQTQQQNAVQQQARAAQAALGTPSQSQVNGTNAVIAGL
ncbi:hypothetical protein HYFRA_00003155 [Hymenoscyphus fraxineus]|uniref:Uncharacterized protein n=1 Tax=Hymenoscyphus fraxineus TaxID=746836 RepID=A0A9N9KST6_9HELO|nr:hypothetical protein HYFRA_00003155 [Hymenoscyphus fraxineus]